MGLKSFFKKLFGMSEATTSSNDCVAKPTVSNPEPAKTEIIEKVEDQPKVETPKVEIDVEKAKQVLETRLNELNNDKKVQEKKVTAKEIKAKVKTDKPVEKSKATSKPKPKTQTQAKPVQKNEKNDKSKKPTAKKTK